MKKSNLLVGAMISGLVAGTAANLSGAQADHHEEAKVEGKEHACGGPGHEHGHSHDQAKKDKKQGKHAKRGNKKAKKVPPPQETMAED